MLLCARLIQILKHALKLEKLKTTCLLKSKTFYNATNPSQERINIINSIENTEPIKLVNENNLSKEEQNALTE